MLPWHSGLRDPAALADLLLDPRIDVRLIRGTYLEKLHQAKQTVIRRQEIETETDAVVTPEELLRWKTDEGFRRRVRIIGVSHVWETMEHPDPTGHQLGMLVNARLWPDKWSWYFFDYMSIYQFYRGYQYSRQQRCFDAAMLHMHFFYAHEHTYTYCIESLTPPDQIDGDRKIEVFFTPDGRGESGQVQTVAVKDLMPNATPANERGWLEAEMQWSSMRSNTKRTYILHSDPSVAWSRAPMQPDLFIQKVVRKELKFSSRQCRHQIVQLHQRVFTEKAAHCESLSLATLPAGQVAVLCHALPSYQRLQILVVTDSCLEKEDAEDLGEVLRVGLQGLQALKLVGNRMDSTALTAIAEGLKGNQSISQVDLSSSMLGDKPARALADLLKQPGSPLQSLNLSHNAIEADGARALAEALLENQRLEKLAMNHNYLADAGALAFADALLTGRVALKYLHLDHNDIGDVGSRAINQALLRAWIRGMRQFFISLEPYGKRDLFRTQVFVLALAFLPQGVCYCGYAFLAFKDVDSTRMRLLAADLSAVMQQAKKMLHNIFHPSMQHGFSNTSRVLVGQTGVILVSEAGWADFLDLWILIPVFCIDILCVRAGAWSGFLKLTWPMGAICVWFFYGTSDYNSVSDSPFPLNVFYAFIYLPMWACLVVDFDPWTGISMPIYNRAQKMVTSQPARALIALMAWNFCIALYTCRRQHWARMNQVMIAVTLVEAIVGSYLAWNSSPALRASIRLRFRKLCARRKGLCGGRRLRDDSNLLKVV
ncbi:NLRC3 [Symbiodinium necroappetens]|uniref:NLRC3 protein n=1 Tax=Symbiodinium necroappetens TaxID=1628268 RepID=A0A812WB16_9DINO|nr:NLRC3 [Symbiodinium necroappetens]